MTLSTSRQAEKGHSGSPGPGMELVNQNQRRLTPYPPLPYVEKEGDENCLGPEISLRFSGDSSLESV